MKDGRIFTFQQIAEVERVFEKFKLEILALAIILVSVAFASFVAETTRVVYRGKAQTNGNWWRCSKSGDTITVKNVGNISQLVDFIEYRDCSCLPFPPSRCQSNWTYKGNDWVDPNKELTYTFSGGDCGVFQVDIVSHENSSVIGDCYLVLNKCRPDCGPSPTPTPTGTPAVSCSSLTLSSSRVKVGETVGITSSFSDYGYVRIGECPPGRDRDYNCLMTEAVSVTTVGFGSTPLRLTFTPSTSGKYIIETNAYDNSKCNWLCSAGGALYRNDDEGGGRCDIGGHWTSIGRCTSGCRQYLTVLPVPSITPTATPTSTPTPTSSPTPTLTPTSTPRRTPTPTPTWTTERLTECVSLSVQKKVGDNWVNADLSHLTIGDRLRFIVSYSGDAQWAAVRIFKNGAALPVDKGLTGGGVYWTSSEYVVGSAGNYEVVGYVKPADGTWR